METLSLSAPLSLPTSEDAETREGVPSQENSAGWWWNLSGTWPLIAWSKLITFLLAVLPSVKCRAQEGYVRCWQECWGPAGHSSHQYHHIACNCKGFFKSKDCFLASFFGKTGCPVPSASTHIALLEFIPVVLDPLWRGSRRKREQTFVFAFKSARKLFSWIEN